MKQSQSSFKSTFFKSLICLIFVYMLGHLTPFIPATSSSIFTSLSSQSLAYAEEDDEEDEEDEDEEEDE